MQAILLLCITLAVSSAQGSPRVRREADPQLLGAPFAPVLYHAPNCTEVEETITIKSCEPKVEENCEDVEVPFQTIEYEKECTTFTAPICTPVEIEVSGEEEAAEKVKREADPQLLYGAHIPYLLPTGLPQYKCEDTEQESCINKPVVKQTSTTIKNCQVTTTVECTEVEQKVPRVTCVHATHAFF